MLCTEQGPKFTKPSELFKHNLITNTLLYIDLKFGNEFPTQAEPSFLDHNCCLENISTFRLHSPMGCFSATPSSRKFGMAHILSWVRQGCFHAPCTYYTCTKNVILAGKRIYSQYTGYYQEKTLMPTLLVG